jgi:hypothetical protein
MNHRTHHAFKYSLELLSASNLCATSRRKQTVLRTMQIAPSNVGVDTHPVRVSERTGVRVADLMGKRRDRDGHDHFICHVKGV